jgi:purine-binding chemotaxis protein CheW
MNTVALPVSALPKRRVEDTRISRWVGFELDGKKFALGIDDVREVLSTATIEAVPGSPPLILGVINLRGRIVTVLDLRQRLGMEPAQERDGCVIIVDFDSEPVALRVDRIAELCNIAEAAIKPAPIAANRRGDEAITGFVSREGMLLTLLDVKLLLKVPGLTP